MFSAPGMRPYFQPPVKRRRTATGVLAGYFDARPPRDVLTSLLNGVGPYRLVEGDEEERRLKRRERKEREKEKRRAKKLQRAERAEMGRREVDAGQAIAGPSTVIAIASGRVPMVNKTTSSFWRTQGAPVLATRSVSPTPPPELSPPSTPDPSTSSSMSYDSSKRPQTPEDGFSLIDDPLRTPPPPRIRKKRLASRKGWKGWVEGSPPPSDKLINLDTAPVMGERRLRSGKNFDAISEGTDTWVKLVPEH